MKRFLELLGSKRKLPSVVPPRDNWNFSWATSLYATTALFEHGANCIAHVYSISTFPYPLCRHAGTFDSTVGI
ncbi:hypothetical protein ANTQUA_LOCUS5008 [Anthophora quadrimaculata]